MMGLARLVQGLAAILMAAAAVARLATAQDGVSVVLSLLSLAVAALLGWRAVRGSGGLDVARLLRPIADVQEGEAGTALMLTLNVFLLLLAYYVLKVVREPLILGFQGGAKLKSNAAAYQAVVLIFVVQAYNWLAQRVSRVKLITAVYLFFTANLVLFYAAGKAAVPGIGVAFFIWVGVFSMFAIASFWSFAADVYTPEQGKRLFAIVGVGATSGSVAGSILAGALKSPDPNRPFQLMLLAATLLVACLVISRTVDARERGRARPSEDKKKVEDVPLGKDNGFALVAKERYLLYIALLMLVLNSVNTTGEYMLGRQVSEAAIQQFGKDSPEVKPMIQGFYSSYFTWVNFLGMVMQLFVVSRVLKYFGVRTALFFLPAVAFGSYAAISVAPLLAVIRVGKIGENTVDYSVQNTTRQALWLPTSREAKYKAKAVVDTIIVRFGDVASNLIVRAGEAAAFSVRQFAFVNVVLVLVWLVLARLIGREHAARTPEAPAS